MTSEEREMLFAKLYQRHYPDVIAFLLRFRFPRERTRELAQDTFLRVYGGMGNYRGDEGGWWSFIKEVARNAALNEIRGQSTGKRLAQEVSFEESSSRDGGFELPSQEKDLIEAEEREHRIQKLKRAIWELPDGTRKALLLWLGGRSYKEISMDLGITIDAVKSRLHDARKRLKKLLGEDPKGIDWPDEASEKDQ